MEKFICERISGGVARIDLGGGAWADLTAVWDDEYGWSLLLEADEPEWVDLWEVYQHFRRKEMTTWEWWQEFDREMAKGKIYDLEKENAVLRRDRDRANAQGHIDFATTLDEMGLPKEVSTGQAASILGVSKDTVLKLKSSGLLEYRNTAPPDSFRPVFAFSLRSVLEVRTSYERDTPLLRRPQDHPRRRIKGERKYKHLRLDPD